MPRVTYLLSVVAIAGCFSLSGCTGADTTPVAPPPADTDKPAAPLAPPPFDPSAMADPGTTLIPSVIETQKALEAAGIGAQLVDYMSERNYDMKNENKDNVSVRTGVVIADVLLTVKTAPKEKLIANLDKISQGMSQLDGGKDIVTTVADIKDRVQGDGVTRDELLKELDELSGVVIPELEFNGEDRIVPLIQAGSWLEGANLVAKAVKKAGKPDAADNLLKQPAVVDYFIKYVASEGKEKAPAAITEKLTESLQVLKGLANKTEPFTNEDIDLVIKTTDDVLALL
jgi:hypothetical protein